jgi:hypothetical protein
VSKTYSTYRLRGENAYKTFSTVLINLGGGGGEFVLNIFILRIDVEEKFVRV